MSVLCNPSIAGLNVLHLTDNLLMMHVSGNVNGAINRCWFMVVNGGYTLALVVGYRQLDIVVVTL